MSLVGFLILLLIAAIAGGIGQSISGYSHGGCVISIIIGFIGAWLGPLIAARLDLPLFWVIHIQGNSFPVVWAIIGGALLSLVLGMILRKRND